MTTLLFSGSGQAGAKSFGRLKKYRKLHSKKFLVKINIIMLKSVYIIFMLFFDYFYLLEKTT